MSTFYEIAGAVLPPLVGCALAAFSVAILAVSLRGIADAFHGRPRELRDLRAEVREVAERIQRRERELWRSAPGAEKNGRGTVALWLDAWATDLWIAIGDYPRSRVAGCEPCHDGRVAGSPTPPRAEVAKKSNV